MVNLILDPVLQRVYSAALMLIAATSLSLTDIGNYSSLIIVLALLQLIFDGDLRNVFLTEGWQNCNSLEARRISVSRIWVPMTILFLIICYLVSIKDAPPTFFLICLVPFSWIATLETHIRSYRKFDTAVYFKSRIIGSTVLNLSIFLALFFYRDVVYLIVLQILLEPVIQGVFKIIDKQTHVKEQSLESFSKKSKIFKYNSASLVNWLVALWDRALLSVASSPSDFGIWSLLMLIFRSITEAFGVGLTSILRRDFLSDSIRIGSRIHYLLYANFTLAFLILLGFEFFFNFFTSIFLPSLNGFLKIGQILTIAASVSVAFWIVNAPKIFKANFKYNFAWAGIVFASSPVVLHLTLGSYLVGSISILIRDLLILVYRLVKEREYGYLRIVVILVGIEILLVTIV